MKIEVNLKADEEGISAYMEKKPAKIASGWVELEGVLKFPVSFQSYVDKEGDMRMFVRYPTKKKESGYENVVYPHDKKLRAEIERAVFEKFKENMMPGRSPAEDITVSLLPDKPGEIKTRALAAAKIMGMTVSGITVKEGKYGLFVEMPQYRTKSGYEDMAYIPGKGDREHFKEAVLEAFQKERIVQAMAVFGFEYQEKPDGGYSALFRHKETGEERDLGLFSFRYNFFDRDENVFRLAERYPLHPEQKAGLEALLCRKLDIPTVDGPAPQAAEQKDREQEAEKRLPSGEAARQLLEAWKENDQDRIAGIIRSAEWEQGYHPWDNNNNYSISSGEYEMEISFYSDWNPDMYHSGRMEACDYRIEFFLRKGIMETLFYMPLLERTGAWKDRFEDYAAARAEWENIVRPEKEAEKAQKETEPAMQLLEAFEKKDRGGVLDAIRKAEWKLERTAATQEGGAFTNQEYSLFHGDCRIYATFYSTWKPGQHPEEEKECRSGIQLAVIKEEEVLGVMKLMEQTGTWQSGWEDYENVRAEWEDLIRPESAEGKGWEPETEKPLSSEEAVRQFLEAFEKEDRARLLETIRQTEWEPEHSMDRDTPAFEYCSLRSGEYEISASFQSSWDPDELADQMREEACSYGIDFSIRKGIMETLFYMPLMKRTGAWQERKTDYDAALAEWRSLIRQKGRIPVKKAPEKAEREAEPGMPEGERTEEGISAKKGRWTHPDPVLSQPGL